MGVAVVVTTMHRRNLVPLANVEGGNGQDCSYHPDCVTSRVRVGFAPRMAYPLLLRRVIVYIIRSDEILRKVVSLPPELIGGGAGVRSRV